MTQVIKRLGIGPGCSICRGDLFNLVGIKFLALVQRKVDQHLFAHRKRVLPVQVDVKAVGVVFLHFNCGDGFHVLASFVSFIIEEVRESA